MATLRPFASADAIRLLGAPSDFDLTRSLREAKRVWLVTAFAHMSGWKMIESALLKSKAKMVFMTGVDFCQSEPRVMRAWVNGSFQAKGAKAFLFLKPGATFHPKVFVVEGRKATFALIGSGNMSAGGFQKNVECFSYLSSALAISDAREWIEGLAADKECCVALNLPYIKLYEKKFKKAAKAKRALQKVTQATERELINRRQPSVQNWTQAIREAREFFKTATFRESHRERTLAAWRIRKLLHHPTYDFSRDEWSEFYGIPELGRLVQIWKYWIFDHRRATLRSALVRLNKSTIPIAERIDDATNIWRVGINLVSKILASIDKRRYPVWNAPVRAALESFGYSIPRGGTVGSKYAAFTEAMQDFRIRTKAPDMLALDCFLFEKGYPLLQRG